MPPLPCQKIALQSCSTACSTHPGLKNLALESLTINMDLSWRYMSEEEKNAPRTAPALDPQFKGLLLHSAEDTVITEAASLEVILSFYFV